MRFDSDYDPITYRTGPPVKLPKPQAARNGSGRKRGSYVLSPEKQRTVALTEGTHHDVARRFGIKPSYVYWCRRRLREGVI